MKICTVVFNAKTDSFGAMTTKPHPGQGVHSLKLKQFGQVWFCGHSSKIISFCTKNPGAYPHHIYFGRTYQLFGHLGQPTTHPYFIPLF